MRSQNVILVVILLIAVGGICFALGVFFQWNKPLGPSLNLPALTPSATSLSTVAPTLVEQAISSSPVATSTQPANSAELVTPKPTPAATKQPLCLGPSTMTILVVGSDQRGTGYLYGLADSIHVVRIDFSIPNVMMVDFPRDLWVEIPGIADHYGITHGKLNQAYLFGNLAWVITMVQAKGPVCWRAR